MQARRSSDYLRTPWKNGGGETLQVAVSPDGATIDNFDWRISLSAVTRDGAFSHFSGVDRTLCLLEGDRIDLVVDGRSVQVAAPDGAHRFRGEAECFARLPAGPIVDLNVMTRRTAHDHRVRRVGEGARLGRAGGHACWFVAATDSSAVSGPQSVVAAARDALCLDPGETADLVKGSGWLIEVSPVL